MTQVNVNTPEPVETAPSGGSDRTSAAGINLITVLIVLGVLAVIAWYLFTGPLHSMMSGAQTTVNVNPPPTTINVNPPPSAPAPVNNAPAPANPAPAPSKP